MTPLAGALLAEQRWPGNDPGDAAVQCFRQGILNVSRTESSIR